jgi:hypothetical protein
MSGSGYLDGERRSGMGQKKVSLFSARNVPGWLAFVGILLVLLSLPLYFSVSLGYTETKGPFKNWTQVADLDGNGNLDVVVSHTRWEAVDESWAGIGRWINQGNDKFELRREDGTGYFAGFAAGAGDVDQDGDPDIFVQDFGIRLLVNQGGLQGGELGKFVSRGEISTPFLYDNGYRDMGGTIVTGDLNGDGRIDAFVAGCCYGLNPIRPGNDTPNAPSVSWVWINEGRVNDLQMGYIIPLDALDGRPIRQAALGDLDGDGDLDVFAAVGKPTMGTIDSLDDLILLNDGTGKLAVFDQKLGNTDSTSVTLGDVNGDGRLDALVGTSRGATLWMNQSNEIGSSKLIFTPAQQSFEAIQTVWDKLQEGLSAAADEGLGIYLPYGSIRTKAVFLSDLDGDGVLDALIARLWGAEVWWNNGQGDFRRSDVRFMVKEDTGVAVGDFDGDGDQDIFTGRNENEHQVWWNDGKGVFRANDG